MPSDKPRKRLPINPSAEHLRKQAKRLAAAESSTLADAQLRLARDYGAASWPELMHVVETMSRGAKVLSGPHAEMEPLPRAAKKGDLALVRELLEQGGFTQHDLDLALARAVMGIPGKLAIAELLIEHGADPDGQYGSNYGPIVLVTGECLNPAGLEFLIRHGCDVTWAPIESKYGKTSPMIATLGAYARGENEDKHRCIDILLQHGAPVPEEVTPEMLAIHRGDAKTLGELIDRDPELVHRRYPAMPYGNVKLAGGTLLHLAVEFGELACVDLLLSRSANINARSLVVDGLGGQTPIFHAVATLLGKGIPVLEHLRRADRWTDLSTSARIVVFSKPIPQAMTVLEYAEWSATEAQDEVLRSKPRELEILRSYGRPLIEDADFAAAVAAIDDGDLAKLRDLLARHPRLVTARAEESGAFVGPYFSHPALLWFIAENPIRTNRMPANVVAIAEAIIDAGASGADIDVTLGLVSSGCVAREQGRQIELIDALVRRGADPSRSLTGAVQERERDAARRLLELGAQPDFAAAAGLGQIERMRESLRSAPPDDLMRRRAMYYAAQGNQVAALELIVREGLLPVNARIGHGDTALHRAALEGHRAVVEALLALGADPGLRDATWNGTPAGWAEHGGHKKLAEYLRQREASR
jgi:peptide-methionine (S)-S-oxide reductase